MEKTLPLVVKKAFAVLLILLPAILYSQPTYTGCETTGDGAWNSAGTWRSANNPSEGCPCNDGYPGTTAASGGQPACPQRVIIRAGDDVSLGSAVRIRFNGMVVNYGTLDFSSGNAGGPNSAELIMDSQSSVVLAPSSTIRATGNNVNQTNNNFIKIGTASINGTAINTTNGNTKPNQLTATNLTTGGCSSGTNNNCSGLDEILASPLPVVLMGLQARVEQGSSVTLRWSTASEQNFHYFTISRSINGRDFHEIGQVQSHGGDSNIKRDYSFTDPQPFGGLNFYKLSSVDFDGYTETFPIIVVQLKGDLQPLVTPNPIADYSLKIIGLTAENPYSLQLVGLNGATVFNAKNIFTPEIDLPRTIPQGIYIAKIQVGDQVFSQKLVIE